MDDKLQQIDDSVHFQMYRQWVGICVSAKEKRGAHKNDDLVRKFDAARKQRRRRKRRRDMDITTIPEEDVEEEYVTTLPPDEPVSNEEQPLAERPSLFWRLLGY